MIRCKRYLISLPIFTSSLYILPILTLCQFSMSVSRLPLYIFICTIWHYFKYKSYKTSRAKNIKISSQWMSSLQFFLETEYYIAWNRLVNKCVWMMISKTSDFRLVEQTFDFEWVSASCVYMCTWGVCTCKCVHVHLHM